MSATGARSPAADDALVRRFSEALARLWPEVGKLGLAVSGGSDSLSMLLLAEATIPGWFEVATVDHGLRPESVDECAMVAQVCAERSIPCEILRVSVRGGNVQVEAREARYDALLRWAHRRGLSALATAHHADDQAETLLMRLNRGSGVAGLAGVRERTVVPEGDLPLIRPLLRFRKAELASLVQQAALQPVADPSNADERFDRARIRKAMAGSDLLDPAAMAVSAANLAEADEALEWAMSREWDEHVKAVEGEVRYRPHAPRAIVLRIVGRAISSIGAEPRGQDVARLVDRLTSGLGGNLGGVLVRASRGEWRFTAEPPRRP